MRRLGGAFAHMQRSINPECDRRVSRGAAHGPCEHRVHAVQAHDPEEIARVDQTLVQDDLGRVLTRGHRNAGVLF